MHDPWFLKDHSPIDLKFKIWPAYCLKFKFSYSWFGLPNIENLRFGLPNIESGSSKNSRFGLSIIDYSWFGNSRFCLPSVERIKMFAMQIVLHACLASSSDLTSAKDFIVKWHLKVVLSVLAKAKGGITLPWIQSLKYSWKTTTKNQTKILWTYSNS